MSRSVFSVLLLAGVCVLLVGVADGQAKRPKLTSTFKSTGSQILVSGKVGKGGPKKPARNRWKAILEQKDRKKWVPLKSVKLTKKGKASRYSIRWKAPLWLSSVELRVKIRAGGRTVAIGLSKKFVLRRETEQPKPQPNPVLFDLAGASALAISNSGSSNAPRPQRTQVNAEGGGESNLDVVEEDGDTRDALVSGSLEVAHGLLAPDGSIYFELRGFANLEDTNAEQNCHIIQLPAGSDTPVCVDGFVYRIFWDQSTGGSPFHQGIQFSEDGDAFYLGYDNRDPDDPKKTVIRRHDSAGTVDVTRLENITDFVVLPDESLLVTVQNVDSPSVESSLIKIRPDGSEETVIPAFWPGFLDVFQDGNVYVGGNFGFSPGTKTGVRRLLYPGFTLEDNYWMAMDDEEAFIDISEACPTSSSGFCAGQGSWAGPGAEIAGQTFLVAGDRFNPITRAPYQYRGQLTRYQPTLGFPDTDVEKVGAVTQVRDQILLTGLDQSGTRIATLFDPISEAETPIPAITPNMEVGVLVYSASNNEVFLLGRFAGTSTYLLGRLDLTSLQMTTQEISEWDAYSEVISL